jgi:hypothetical protein
LVQRSADAAPDGAWGAFFGGYYKYVAPLELEMFFVGYTDTSSRLGAMIVVLHARSAMNARSCVTIF